MKALCWLASTVLFTPLALGGCGGSSTDKKVDATDARVSDNSAGQQGEEGESDEGEIQAELAKLNPQDRKMAEEQRFCPVMSDNRLGSMGVPFKVMVKDQPVFLCCKGCRRQAQADPNKTLTKVRDLRAEAARTPAN